MYDVEQLINAVSRGLMTVNEVYNWAESNAFTPAQVAAMEEKLNDRPIDGFTGEYAWLSNFWLTFITDTTGVTWPSAEHAYQAMKTTDQKERLIIRNMATPAAAKRAGAKLELRPDWDSIKLDVMRRILNRKFAPRTQLARKLMATGKRKLVEGNYWGDTFWGVCKGRGANWLGVILMEIRDRLNEMEDHDPGSTDR